ncbi:hypothetical protein R1sor_027558 [Riccia sorocarpa]|uniref:Uncharacterized protein n=1 Tax=Riccia sorocarpa TaxID=122646 RepID=A0ABD3GEI6_9MARC
MGLSKGAVARAGADGQKEEHENGGLPPVEVGENTILTQDDGFQQVRAKSSSKKSGREREVESPKMSASDRFKLLNSLEEEDEEAADIEDFGAKSSKGQTGGHGSGLQRKWKGDEQHSEESKEEGQDQGDMSEGKLIEETIGQRMDEDNALENNLFDITKIVGWELSKEDLEERMRTAERSEKRNIFEGSKRRVGVGELGGRGTLEGPNMMDFVQAVERESNYGAGGMEDEVESGVVIRIFGQGPKKKDRESESWGGDDSSNSSGDQFGACTSAAASALKIRHESIGKRKILSGLDVNGSRTSTKREDSFDELDERKREMNLLDEGLNQVRMVLEAMSQQEQRGKENLGPSNQYE